MNNFSLSKSKENTLPEHVDIDGKAYAIDPSFRTVLKMLRLMEDPEIPDRHKFPMLIGMFYPDESPDIASGMEAFYVFTRGPDKKRDPEAASIDFEFDADVIFASFLSEYNINLLDESLHWFVFMALLNSLTSGSALAERLSLRKLDTSKLKGKARTSAEIAKKNAQPPQKISESEKTRQLKMAEALNAGVDPATLSEE